MFKSKSGIVKEKIDNYDFIKLMIPSNYEIHPSDTA